jgi:hypothetical protein
MITFMTQSAMNLQNRDARCSVITTVGRGRPKCPYRHGITIIRTELGVKRGIRSTGLRQTCLLPLYSLPLVLDSAICTEATEPKSYIMTYRWFRFSHFRSAPFCASCVPLTTTARMCPVQFSCHLALATFSPQD